MKVLVPPKITLQLYMSDMSFQHQGSNLKSWNWNTEMF